MFTVINWCPVYLCAELSRTVRGERRLTKKLNQYVGEGHV